MTPANREELEREKIGHTLGFFAKLLCSGTFVVGRDPDEFLAHDLKTHLRPEGMPLDWDEIAVSIDREAKTVTLAARGIARTAVCNAGQGCTIVPSGANGLSFTPVPIGSDLPDATTTPWPIGDLLLDDPPPPSVDQAALAAALDLAMDDTRQPVPMRTRGLVVVHKGRIIGERYAPGFTKDTRQISWSMGKSITAALIGTLVRDGHFGIDDPAPIAEWRQPGDPRGAITIRHLLNMSSGLKFLRAQDDARLELGWTRFDDHMYIYYGAIDVFAHSIARRAADPPGAAWRYRNGDPLTLGKIIRQTVEGRGDDYLTFPQRALFDRIGMRHMTLEPDPWGNFIMTGFDYGTPRDWARFGLLHLWDGVWRPSGERILPEGWVDFVRTPAPADAERHYGGQFWLNAGGRLPNVPRDAFHPAGAWGQVVVIIPSRDMVIVRMGHSSPLDNAFDGYLDRTVEAVVGAVG